MADRHAEPVVPGALLGETTASVLLFAAVVGCIDQSVRDGGGGVAAGQNLSSLYNVIYGQKVWSMINQEINPLSVLPKRPYTSSGWRVMTKRPIGGSAAAFGIGTIGFLGASELVWEIG